MVVEFDEELFNPIYHEFIEAFRNEDIRFIIAYGGSSASKTYSFVQSTITENLENPSNTLVLRKYSTDIADSVFSDFRGVINDWDLGSKIYSVQRNIIKNNINGTYFRFRGLDDPEKIKGIAQFKRIVLEEANQFDKQDLDQIRKRLRGQKGQQIILIFNPIDEEHWIKTKIIDTQKWITKDSEITEKKINETGNAVVLRTTYLDNKYIVGPYFIDKHCIQDFEFDKKNDYEFYRIYALGEWGHLNKGGEFYKHFDSSKHITKTSYKHNEPLHISFDENVHPYITLTVWQIDGLRANQIDEICLEHPRNTIKDLCHEFSSRYRLHTGRVAIYGDATSRKEDTKLEKGQNFYTLIMSYLSKYNIVNRVQKRNQPVAMRGQFLNEVFRLEHAGINIRIGENCKKTIQDYRYLKEKDDFTKLKEKVKDPVTGITYEKYGHTSDANDYLLCTVFSAQYNAYITGSKKVEIIGGRRSPRAYKNAF